MSVSSKINVFFFSTKNWTLNSGLACLPWYDTPAKLWLWLHWLLYLLVTGAVCTVYRSKLFMNLSFIIEIKFRTHTICCFSDKCWYNYQENCSFEQLLYYFLLLLTIREESLLSIWQNTNEAYQAFHLESADILTNWLVCILYEQMGLLLSFLECSGIFVQNYFLLNLLKRLISVQNFQF